MVISKSVVKALFLMGLVVLGWGIHLGDELPDHRLVDPRALAEPSQVSPTKAAFKTTVKGIEYAIKPVADYEITGVVVSRHDTAAFWDKIHIESNDHLNVADLCIAWGHNLKSNNYKAISYSNGQFTCNFGTASEAVWSAFDLSALSNNHLLTDDRAMAKRIAKLKVGDQVRVKGHLAIYRHHHGFPFERGTSVVRTDVGNGACETIFVSEVELLKPASAVPRWTRTFGWLLLLLATVAWFGFTGYGTE
jgi:hypothetical protein